MKSNQLQTVEERFGVKSQAINDAYRMYAFNCISAFLIFIRIARLAEINAPGSILDQEIAQMVNKFEIHGFTKKGIEGLIKILDKEYPNISVNLKSYYNIRILKKILTS